MIAAAIVCAAAMAQASAFSWSMSTMTKAYEAGSGTKKTLWSGQAYLFAESGANAYAQATLLDAALAGGIDFTKAVASSAVTDGVLSGNTPTATAKAFSYGTDGVNNNFYLVLVDADMVYVGTSSASPGAEGKTVNVATKGTNSNLASADWKSGSTFSTAGWYNTVPEPTSGLLLLIGMAGLALRRRRA